MRNNKGQFKKGDRGYWLGKKRGALPKEWKDKISSSHKGKIPKNFEEFRKKGTLACIGRKPWNKGIPHSLKTKEKISKVLKGHTPWNKGKNPTKKTRMKMSQARIGKSPWNKGKSFMAVKGKNNVNWKGGITPINKALRESLEYEEWRTVVFERDLYTCQLCEQIGGKLNADHIKPFALYPELRFNVNNGQTLCENCHSIKTAEDMKLIRKEIKPWART